MNRLKGELAETKIRNSDFESENMKLHEEIQRMKQEYDTYHTQALEKISTLEQQRGMLTTENERLLTIITKDKETIDDLENRLISADDEIDRLEEELFNLKKSS